MTAKIQSLGRSNPKSKESVVQMLREMAARLESGQEDADQALVLFLRNPNKGEYNLGWCQTGMRMSECVALCEIAKIDFADNMNYPLLKDR